MPTECQPPSKRQAEKGRQRRGPPPRPLTAPLSGTEWVEWMSHRKWRETKQQPGTAGPGNILGCCLVSLCFLYDIHSNGSIVRHDSGGGGVPPELRAALPNVVWSRQEDPSDDDDDDKVGREPETVNCVHGVPCPRKPELG